MAIPPEQARRLIAYHDKNLAWMHNVIHMPTFHEQCEYFFRHGQPIDPFWLPLYYSTLSVRLARRLFASPGSWHCYKMGPNSLWLR